MLSSLTTLLRNPYFFHRKGPAPGGPPFWLLYILPEVPLHYTTATIHTYIQPSFFTTLWLVIFPLYTQRPGDTGRQGGLQQWQRGDSDLRWGNGPAKFLRATNEECYRCPRRIAAGISGPSGRLRSPHFTHRTGCPYGFA